MEWENNERNIFGEDCLKNIVLGLLWVILIKREIQNDAVSKEAIIIGIIILHLHDTDLDMMEISLKVLIEGGADIFKLKKINHQKLMLGDIEINPLNKIILREWIFMYRSFTSKNNPDEDIPWAIIMKIAPLNPILLIVKILINVRAIWATDE